MSQLAKVLDAQSHHSVEFLKAEFDSNRKDTKKKNFQLNGSSLEQQIDFYKRLILANSENLLNKFVPFTCSLNNVEVLTEQLPDLLFRSNGATIIGPSGCGKSILINKLAHSFISLGHPIIVEAKYYDHNLETLLTKKLQSFGLNSLEEFLNYSAKNRIPILLIIDGINECSENHLPKLMLELEQVMTTQPIKLLITSQKSIESSFYVNLQKVEINYPDQDLKRSIAAIYSSKRLKTNIEPVLTVISTSLEAKMIGEIDLKEIYIISRFALFEIFIKGKLSNNRINGFVLLSLIAKSLSESVSFNLSERAVEQILYAEGIDIEVYEKCLSTGLLSNNIGKVSFSHEMFFNFFVADSIVRFAKEATEIEVLFNLPKNQDKKLLIIGSIDNVSVLDYILSNLNDVDLLTSLYWGEGGAYCQKWLEKKLNYILKLLESEVKGLEFEFNENAFHGIRFQPKSLMEWNKQELALVNVFPNLIIKEHFLFEIFELVKLLNEQCLHWENILRQDTRKRKISIKSAIFSAAHMGMDAQTSAISAIFSTLRSGSVFFGNECTISLETIKKLLASKSLKFGQFYFLLLVNRYDKKNRELYPYVINILIKWRSAPYHLLTEVLQQIGSFPNSENERINLINYLNTIHGETVNPWMSTMIFDALATLGALEDDTQSYIPQVREQIGNLLPKQNDTSACEQAANIYYSQFDHPYELAFNEAITQLNDTDRRTFYRMALEGSRSTLFTSALILEAHQILKEETGPYLVRWTFDPFVESSFQQDSITIFLISHILLGKYEQHLDSRLEVENDKRRRSLLAIGELYYWLNFKDLDNNGKKEKCRSALGILFDENNSYAIDTIWQSHMAISQSSILKFIRPSKILSIREFYKEQILMICRKSLSDLQSQRSLYKTHNNEQVNKQAIWLIKELGNIVDIDILKNLANHSIYGEDAVNAIKKLS